MKRKINIIFLAIISFFMVNTRVLAITYNQAKSDVQEVMKAYYLKGPIFQYNYSRVGYGTNSPEEATYQDRKFLVCAGYTYSVMTEAFGMNDAPKYNYDITNAAAEYYSSTKPKDGTYLIWYQNTTAENEANYIYSKDDASNVSVEEIADIVRPGDMVAYTGHALMVYDVGINPSTNKKDVLILNSTSGNKIITRSEGTSNLYYNYLAAPEKNNIIDIPNEGTIKYLWLSNSSQFVKNGKLSCNKDECAIIRMFYEDSNHNAIFNYNIDNNKLEKTKLRTTYPLLTIEKTVDKGDSSYVYLNDSLTYTIKIKNNSTTNYSSFVVQEVLTDMVEFESANNNGKLNDNKITWEIANLGAGEEINLKYKVTVKVNYNNINSTVKSIGYFAESKSKINESTSITTGTVENKIYQKYTPKESYETCYNKYKDSKTGLELIDSIYQCATNENFNFQDFSFNKILTIKTGTAKGSGNLVTLKAKDITNAKYLDMIYNDYYSGLTDYNIDGSLEIHLPRWYGSKDTRKLSISQLNFKDGDVLIYYASNKIGSIDKNIETKENGLYAYIYLNGKFVGKNGTLDSERNDYTYKYYIDKGLDPQTTFYSGYDSSNPNEELYEYLNFEQLYGKDKFVILRPELLLKDLIKIDLDNNSSEVKLNMETGFLKALYSDGSVKNIPLSDASVEISSQESGTTKTYTISYNGKKIKYNETLEQKPKEEEKNSKENPNTGSSIVAIIAVLVLGTIICIFGLSRKRKMFNI